MKTLYLIMLTLTAVPCWGFDATTTAADIEAWRDANGQPMFRDPPAAVEVGREAATSEACAAFCRVVAPGGVCACVVIDRSRLRR